MTSGERLAMKRRRFFGMPGKPHAVMLEGTTDTVPFPVDGRRPDLGSQVPVEASGRYSNSLDVLKQLAALV